VSSSQHFQLPLGQQRSVLLHEGLLVPEQEPSPVPPEDPLLVFPEDAPPEEFCEEEFREEDLEEELPFEEDREEPDELGLLEEREDDRLLEDSRTKHGAGRVQLMPWLMR
jgi:hypothetical protein